MSSLSAYLALTKPRLTLMVLFTAFSAFYIASQGAMEIPQLGRLLLGAALVGAGSNALNQYLEREMDAKMKRTKDRPIPSGKIERGKALGFGVVLAAIGLLCLWFFVNPLTAMLGALILISYIGFYTTLKQKTRFNTLLGAVPGALPTLMGWVAARNSLNREAWVIFLILFLWQLPHFFAIAWVYRLDYKEAGFRMLTVSDEDGKSTALYVGISSLALFAASLLPTLTGLTGGLYLSAALVAGFLFLGVALYVASHRMAYAKEFVVVSILYLAVLNIFLLFDKI